MATGGSQGFLPEIKKEINEKRRRLGALPWKGDVFFFGNVALDVGKKRHL